MGLVEKTVRFVKKHWKAVATVAVTGLCVVATAHLFTAHARGEKITARNGFGWLIGSGVSGAGQGVFRLRAGSGTAGYALKWTARKLGFKGRWTGR